MAKFPFPWYRVVVFTLLIAAVGVWIHLRGLQEAKQGAGPEPASGIGRSEEVPAPVVALYVLSHAVPEGEPPLYWMRVDNVAFDVPWPGPEADPGLQAHAREVRASLLEALGEELEDLRREAEDPDVVVGEVRRDAAVPPDLYMEAFQLFIQAGYGKVNMALTEAKPPGRPPR